MLKVIGALVVCGLIALGVCWALENINLTKKKEDQS